jgi:hypothetical protein
MLIWQQTLLARAIKATMGGATGNTIWNADITIRSFDVIKGQAL